MDHDHPTAEFSGIVLAGGTGARMGGVDKGRLEVDRRTLLATAIAALGDAEEIVVVGPATQATTRPVTNICEDPPLGGPAAGLLAGLAALHRETRKVGVLAVDMPRVTVDTFRRLRAAADGRDGAVLVDATGRSQLCCVLDVARVSAVAPAPAERHGLPVHRLLGRLSLAEVDADTDEARDIDYWSDLHDLDS